VVLEVYDKDGRLDRIVELLERRGFTLHVEQDRAFRDTAMYNVYATRSAGRAEDRGGTVEWRVETGSADALSRALRTHLRERLPEHMVPAAFVALDRLPLSANGKLDRRALPAAQFGGETEYAAPATEMEELLCQIWLDVLNSGETQHARVGIHDNFFALGGHSLLAMQVVARIHDALGIRVPLGALFEAPTVAAFTTRVEDLFIAALDDSELTEQLSRLESVGDPDTGQ
ncbi:MAG TPA: phosphopantetheine-binding protein, partial [Longimicrobiaceae bacterium]